MKTELTERDWQNPQRFIGEGLGAPELQLNREAKAQAGCLHLCAKKQRIGAI